MFRLVGWVAFAVSHVDKDRQNDLVLGNAGCQFGKKVCVVERNRLKAKAGAFEKFLGGPALYARAGDCVLTGAAMLQTAWLKCMTSGK